MVVAKRDGETKRRFLTRRHRVEVEFHHVDMMRVVYNAQYFKWFEKGRFAVVDDMFQDDAEARDRLVTPVVMNRCDYLKPARLGDGLVVTTRHPVESRWTGRFRFEHSVSNARTKVELARGESEITVVDASSFVPVRRLPETVWNRYQNLR